MFHLNRVGLVIVGLGLGIGMGVSSLTGYDGEGQAMLIAGPLIALGDVAWRRRKKVDLGLIDPEAGGTILLIPAWLLGLLWFGLGAVYAMRGE